ncbi:hypothetical protein HCB82_20610 [Paenibacillus sp. 7028]|nr:hypothetical protein [Paenibacillus apii]
MELENHFPNLRYTPWSLTSPRTPEYNCIAWAASENDRWWWPDKAGLAYWPDEVPREVTLDAFIAAYGTLGYKTCDDDKLESGFEKIAIYIDNWGNPTHAASQLASGAWTSKCGNSNDITHTLDGLKDSEYGRVGQIMKRLRLS